MRRCMVVLATTLAVMSACEWGGSGNPASEGRTEHEERVGAPVWNGPANYEFDLESSCGERNLIGRFHIVVEAGAVVEAEGLDRSGRVLVRSEFGDSIPTLAELVEEAADARRSNADVAEVTFGGRDGHPTRIDIDYEKDAIDDEACYVITDYKLRPLE